MESEQYTDKKAFIKALKLNKKEQKELAKWEKILQEAREIKEKYLTK